MRRLSYSEDNAMAFIEGIMQAEYSFNKYLEKKEDVTFTITLAKEIDQDKVQKLINLMEGVFVARDLVNEPANVLTPTIFAERVQKLFEGTDVTVEVHNKEEIEKLGMKAYLSVAMGSDEQPALMVLKYEPNKQQKKPIALVGKALTYDSGGYCIKPASGMLTMHCDMGGAGAVIGTFYALAKNKVQTNVVGVCAACENMISGHAYRTGDIISSYLGKSIYVENTDAEGRLTLVDALAYANERFEPEYIVDMATLTGACIHALGFEYSAMITNCDDLAEKMEAASKKQSEKIWRLPIDDDFREQLKSDVADVSNVGARKGAGTITAGAFLEAFVEKTPWMHLDIAGTAYLDAKEAYLPKRATGAPVKALYQMIEDESL